MYVNLFLERTACVLHNILNLCCKSHDTTLHIFLRFELGDKLFYPGEAGPSNLTHLSITNCDLGVLRADVFLGLGKLQTLTLDYCEITDIENSFKHLENLKELSLAYCEGTEQLSLFVITKAGIFDAGFGEVLRSPSYSGEKNTNFNLIHANLASRSQPW